MFGVWITSKPEACRSHSIFVYSSIEEEPRYSTIMPSRCTNGCCRHRGNYVWDIIPSKNDGSRIFHPLKVRHWLPYWVCSAQTAFVTSMISQGMLSQVLWNHAASANMANQGNWLNTWTY